MASQQCSRAPLQLIGLLCISSCVILQALLKQLGCSVQEDGSGCEGQSSCTVLAPSAKRIKRDYRATLTSPILESACSFESTTPHACKGPLDVVGDNAGHLTSSACEAEMTDGNDEGGKPQVRNCLASGVYSYISDCLWHATLQKWRLQ